MKVVHVGASPLTMEKALRARAQEVAKKLKRKTMPVLVGAANGDIEAPLYGLVLAAYSNGDWYVPWSERPDFHDWLNEEVQS